MILPDYQIELWARENVTPFDPKMVNPASLDLKLGNEIRVPHPIWETMTKEEMQQRIEDRTIFDLPKWSAPITFDEFWLYPRGMGPNFILCSSLEYVNIPDDMAAILYSKSSTGRNGIEHLHAGYGDPGWGGTRSKRAETEAEGKSFGAQWTWEIHSVAPWPIPLYPGKPLMQQVMIRLTDTPLRTYQDTGRYNGQAGPTPERPEVHR